MSVLPSVDVTTGIVTPANTAIDVGDQFVWTCASASPNTAITVTAVGQPWFLTVASPQVDTVQFTTPAVSQPVIAELASPPDWTWKANVYVDQNAHVNVGVHMPVEEKRAS
jgi:hypothetical protein